MLTAQQKKMTIGSDEYNEHAKKIAQLKSYTAEHNANLKQLQTTWAGTATKAETSMQKMGASFKNMFAAFTVGGIAANAFTSIVSGIKAFVAESSDAFVKADEAVKQLSFSVKQVGGGSDSDIAKLTSQASDLMGVFDDEAIRKAQTDLLNYGLSAEEVYKLIPTLLDTSAASGRELSDVTSAVIRGIEGQTKGLKTLGVDFKDSGDAATNLSTIQTQLAKFTGGATEALNTEAGQLKALDIQMEESQEKLGAYTIKITKAWAQIKNAATKILGMALMNSEEIALSQTDNMMSELTKKWAAYGTSIENIVAAAAKKTGKSTNDIARSMEASAKAEMVATGIAYDNAKRNGKLTDEIRERHIYAEIKYKKILELETAVIKEKSEATTKGDETEDKTKKTLVTTYGALTAEISKLTEIMQGQLADGYTEAAALTAKTIAEKTAEKEAIDKLVEQYKLLGEAKLTAENPTKIKTKGTTKLEGSKRGLATQGADTFLDQLNNENELRLSAEEKTQAALLELRTQGIDTLEQLVNAYIDRQYAKEMQAVDKKYTADETALKTKLNKGLITQQQYDTQLAALEKKKAAEELKLKQQKAKDQKLVDIGKIGVEMALAIMSAYAPPPVGLGPLGGSALLPIILAQAALQTAVVAAQPIPEFADGGFTKHAKMYIAGEAGTEYIAPNSQVSDPFTGPIIQDLERMRKGKRPKYISEMPVTPDFNALSSVSHKYASGGYNEVDNYIFRSRFAKNTRAKTEDLATAVNGINERLDTLNSFMMDPKNRRAKIVRDELTRFDDETAVLDSLSQIK
ncbi:MAG: hypothetical protein WCY05_04165 [Candidatus Omnitrophota bacterium]